MSLNYATLADGRELPVGTGVTPVGGFDADGNPKTLLLDADGKLMVSGTGGEGGGAVTIADGANVALGAKADAAATADTGAFSLVSLQKRGLAHLSTFLERAFGLAGSVYVTDTDPVTGTFGAIQALDDTVVASITSSDITGTLTNIPIPAGVVIYGTITAFTLTSGKVIAYDR